MDQGRQSCLSPFEKLQRVPQSPSGSRIAMICVGLSSWRAPAHIEAGVVTAYLLVIVDILPLPQIFPGASDIHNLGRSKRL
jgi:hypothetical protein